VGLALLGDVRIAHHQPSERGFKSSRSTRVATELHVELNPKRPWSVDQE
jgi:hypothetical protein